MGSSGEYNWVLIEYTYYKDLDPTKERETEVLALVAEGLTNTQVAQRLHVSANTVKFHLKNIYEQLNVTNRTEASRWYLKSQG